MCHLKNYKKKKKVSSDEDKYKYQFNISIIDENNEFKVCEFSYCFEHIFLENSFYYDIKEEKILKKPKGLSV